MPPTISNLGNTVMVGCGAIGTYLRESLQTDVDSLEMLNLDDPYAIHTLHTEYVEAGSQILITNTFAANPIRLEEHGQAHRCDAINSNGVRLAREAGGDRCLVWASVGPMALGFRLDDYSDTQLEDAYRRQCGALADADAIALETIVEPREARAALAAACSTGLPVIMQIGTLAQGSVRWNRARELVALATDAGAAAVGTNCAHPHQIAQMVKYLTSITDLPVTASPNAGNPDFDRGQVIYDFSPDDLLAVGRRLVSAGACVVGGCCGTTPEHIRRLAPAIKDAQVVRRADVTVEEPADSRAAPVTARPPNRIRDLMQGDDFVISVEIRPTRNRPLNTIVDGVRAIAQAGADMFDVPDNAAATVGRDSMVTAATLQRELSLPAMSHKTVTQSNNLHLHSELIGCWDLGLQGVLVITGDVPKIGHMGSIATRVADLRSSVELLRLITRLRGGELITGDTLADPPDFCAGCGMGSGKNLKPQRRWLEKKIEAGAEFVFSQPVFTFEQYERLRDAVADAPVRLLPGVLGLTSLGNAQFLASGRIPGIEVAEDVVKAFEAYEDKDDQREHGIEACCKLAAAMKADGARGLYVIMPFGKRDYQDTARVVSAAR